MVWNKGQHHSPETRAKMSASHSGVPLSSDHLTKMKAGHVGLPGPVLTPEQRERLSLALMGHAVTPETRARIGSAQRGQVRGPLRAETRRKLSVALRGRVFTDAHRARISSAKMGNTGTIDATVKGECVYCFGPATTHDHVIPRGRPGWDDPENVVLACHSCNASKRNRTPEEWLEAMQG
jgi:5-methylcytosine-specific restriction endonuclease McrA